MKIEILDTTLRDGEQGAGIEFSDADKIKVIRALDSLGVTYIEAGMITDSKGAEFFDRLGCLETENAKIAVFTMTCKPGEDPASNELLNMAAAAPVPAATIFGKSWLYQVTDVLCTTPEENLRIIRDSVSYLVKSGKEVIFDAEHFFDGYSDSPEYAMETLRAAFDGGASRAVLCDTNGGMLPDVVGMICRAVCTRFKNIGIHCHNDMGMAAACTVSGVLSGACQVHTTVSGIGERCGNANMNTVVPVLQLKLGFDCIGDRISKLTPSARFICEAANISFNENEPFVGGYAFTHKAGSHIDGMRKAPRSFEHIPPETVGNERNFLISGLSGRSAVIEKMEIYMKATEGAFSKDDPRVEKALSVIKEREAAGYNYEDAGASLALLIDETLGTRKSFFSLVSLKATVEERPSKAEADGAFAACAEIKISVNGSEYAAEGKGNGPVNAIDEALRHALTRFYPEISDMYLTDYKVRVLDSRATASSVRVSIESSSGPSVWRTVGVSSDVIDASWQALRDSVEYMLSRTSHNKEASVK